MLEEGIYLFFDNDVPVRADHVTSAVDPGAPFMQTLKSRFARDFDPEPVEDPDGLKPLGRRAFERHCARTRAVRFVCIRSFLELGMALSESAEAADRFRDVIANDGFMFGAEVFDASRFWTGASIRRWFRSHFPPEPKAKRCARPASVLDLLNEFLEGARYRPDDLVAVKETMAAVGAEERLLLQDMLRGNDPGKSKKTEAAAARILTALADRRA